MRLIDANWVLAYLKRYEEWSVSGGTALRLIHKAVNNAPTVDAVAVTRCKACKHLVSVNADGKGIPTCQLSGRAVAHDEFCSRGEKGRM
mgnify:CR=1 FL=1